MKRLLELLGFYEMVDEVRYAIAATRWEGWGRKGDPRNERPLLTREEWKRRRGD